MEIRKAPKNPLDHLNLSNNSPYLPPIYLSSSNFKTYNIKILTIDKYLSHSIDHLHNYIRSIHKIDQVIIMISLKGWGLTADIHS